MAITHNTDIYKLLKSNIEQTIRGNIKKDIKDTLIQELSEKIDHELEPMLKQITIESLEQIMDMDRVGVEFNLHVKVSK